MPLNISLCEVAYDHTNEQNVLFALVIQRSQVLTASDCDDVAISERTIYTVCTYSTVCTCSRTQYVYPSTVYTYIQNSTVVVRQYVHPVQYEYLTCEFVRPSRFGIFPSTRQVLLVNSV
jgi:hypothetical protein